MEFIETTFHSGIHVITALNELIDAADKKLILISPYIDLDHRIKTSLIRKKDNPHLHICVLFGKNEENLSKSIKIESLTFFKEFPNIEIYYEPRLHVKYYQNDFEFLLTSLNLYNFSIAQNIEFGVSYRFDKKTFLGKLDVSLGNSYESTITAIKNNVIGSSKQEVDPREEMKKVISESTLLYKTQPRFIEKKGLSGILGGKVMDGFDVTVNKIEKYFKLPFINQIQTSSGNSNVAQANSEIKISLLSASAISRKFGVSIQDVNNLMTKKGFISGETITEDGKKIGLVKKTFKGIDYVAYPENLDALSELIRQN